MADNGAIEQLPVRTLSHVVGNDGSGRAARQPTNTLVPTSRQVVGDTGLTGGGQLSGDVTIKLSSSSLSSLGKADSAMQPSVYDPNEMGVSAFDAAHQIDVCATAVSAKIIPAPVLSFRTSGYNTSGDGGGALYHRVSVQPSHSLYFTDFLGGGYWEIAEPVLYAKMAGVIADGATDDYAAIDRAFRYIEAKGGGKIILPPNNMRMTGDVGWCDGLALEGVPGMTKFTLDNGVNAEMFTNKKQASAVTIDDLSLYGIIFDANSSHDASYAQSAVTVNGYQRLRAKACVFEGATGYGLALQARPLSTLLGVQTQCWLTDCIFRNNGYNATSDNHDGIDAKSADKMWVTNCIAYGNADAGINIRGVYVDVNGCVAYDNVTYGVNIETGVATAGYSPAICSLRGLKTFNNGARGTALIINTTYSGDPVTAVTMDDIISYGNALDGILVSDVEGLGRFKVTASNLHSWGNGNHGFNDASSGGELTVVNGLFEGNTKSGATCGGSNRTYAACHFLTNGEYGFDETGTAANNKVLGSHFDGNTLGPVSLNSGGNTEVLGCIGASTPAVSRANLGLGTAAVQNTGTSGATVPLLNTANAWSGIQTFGAASGDAQVRINALAGQAAFVRGSHAGVVNWLLQLGDNATQSGSNVGADFRLDRYDDTGASLGNAILIRRSSGDMSVSGVLVVTKPLKLASFTVATVPSAAANPQGIIYVSDGTGNKLFAISDGTNWRFPDGAIVS